MLILNYFDYISCLPKLIYVLIKLIFFVYTEPDPPTNVICTQQLDTSLEISWDAPTKPNGLIKYYLIDIFLLGNKVKTINSSTNATSQKVDALEPGKMNACKYVIQNGICK